MKPFDFTRRFCSRVALAITFVTAAACWNPEARCSTDRDCTERAPGVDVFCDSTRKLCFEREGRDGSVIDDGGGGAFNDSGCASVRPDGGDLVTIYIGQRQVLQNADEIPLPQDRVVAVWSYNAGTFTSHPITRADAGLYLVAGAPAEFQVEFRTAYNVRTLLVASSRSIDLSEFVLGREEAHFATSGTSLTVDAGLLAPWGPFDDLLLVSANARVESQQLASNPGLISGGPPATGDTHALMAIDYSGNRLVEANKGDTMYVVQTSAAVSDAGFSYGFVSSAGFESSLTMSDGAENLLALQMAPVVRNKTFRSRYFPTDFIPAQTPGAAHFISVAPMPLGSERGIYALLPTLAETRLLSADGGQSWDRPDAGLLVTFDFGSPYPSSWTPIVSVVVRRTEFRNLTVDAGTQPVQVSAFSDIRVPFNEFPVGGDLHAEAWPVSELEVDGSPTVSRLNNASLTPKVKWTAPAEGAVHAYLLRIVELVPTQTTFGKSVRTVTIMTNSASVRIPPGFLRPSTQYVFSVETRKAPRMDYCRNPTVVPTPSASATLVSEVVQTRGIPDGG